MKSLVAVTPTPEQLVLVSNPRPGVQVLRGAAGSGKTTTALLMLRQLSSFWVRRKQRLNIPGKTSILVVTFNRTLRGYIQELAEKQLLHRQLLDLTVSTFGKWSRDRLPSVRLVDNRERKLRISQLSAGIPLPNEFIAEEIDYLLGRFPANRLSDYPTCTRIGRGAAPRVDRTLRQRLLVEVVYPYIAWKNDVNGSDWDDLATQLVEQNAQKQYDIVVADEAQDLSANQVRAIMHVAADPSSVVFVLDAAQRIYPRGFTWTEAGVSVTRSHRLGDNHRNTKQICKFAEPLLRSLDIGDDGAFPDFDTCVRNGPLPLVIKGLYSQQVDHVLNHITSNIDLSRDSVAFLKPLGSGWFKYLREALQKRGLKFVELTREGEWPTGPENIALSTMHSAKGLEFDHVVVLGLNDEVTPHGDETGDTAFENLRRLLAMAITRARETVILGYKPGEGSSLVALLDSSTYTEESL